MDEEAIQRQIAEWYTKGKSIGALAKTYGLTPYTVRHFLKLQNVRFRSKNPKTRKVAGVFGVPEDNDPIDLKELEHTQLVEAAKNDELKLPEPEKPKTAVTEGKRKIIEL